MAMDTQASVTLSSIEGIPQGADVWAENGIEADASTAVAVKATPGAGKSLYITDVIITCDDDDALPQLQNTAGSPAVLLGPFVSKAAGPLFLALHFRRAIIVPANTGINLKCAAAGSVSLFIAGYTALNG